MTAANRELRARPTQYAKCVVWDLDNTVWSGTLLENDEVRLQEGIRVIIETFDSRGILQSIASLNDPGDALTKLRAFNLDGYFLYPQIGWGLKSDSIRVIADRLSLGIESFVFVDDDPFQLEEVRAVHPAVHCVAADQLPTILDLPCLNPPCVSEDARNRREMYRAAEFRDAAEADYPGSNEEFLAASNMKLRIHPVRDADLRRAEELTLRTNQLNSTGYTYSYDELRALQGRADFFMAMATLEDRFGSYGCVGLIVLDQVKDAWNIRLLLASCRVLSKGVGAVLLTFAMRWAKSRGRPLRAEFIPNGRNRIMMVTFRFHGFREIDIAGGKSLLEHSLENVPDFPPYMKVVVDSELGVWE